MKPNTFLTRCYDREAEDSVFNSRILFPHLFIQQLTDIHRLRISFRLVYFKHKEIFLAVCIVSDEGSVNNYARLPV